MKLQNNVQNTNCYGLYSPLNNSAVFFNIPRFDLLLMNCYYQKLLPILQAFRRSCVYNYDEIHSKIVSLCMSHLKHVICHHKKYILICIIYNYYNLSFLLTFCKKGYLNIVLSILVMVWNLKMKSLCNHFCGRFREKSFVLASLCLTIFYCKHQVLKVIIEYKNRLISAKE